MKYLLLQSIIPIFVALIFAPSCNNTQKVDIVDNSKNTIAETIIAIEKESVLKRADELLNSPIPLITDTSCSRSAGNKHDYYSEGTYWWQNPEDSDGAYIRKDGLKNPDNFVAHEHAIIKFSWSVGTLTSAYLLTNDNKYAQAAINYLKAWFVDTTTMMNPNLLYAQAINGRCTGRGIGIIDASCLIEVAISSALLEQKSAINNSESKQVKQWFADFTNWILTHPYGVEELNWKNNHGTWCNAQLAAYASYVGNNKVLDSCRHRYKTKILPNQMAVDGSFPLELERTKPYAYSIFNTDGMVTLVAILSDATNDLWNFKLDDGRSIKKGIDFISPFVMDKNKWTYTPDVSHWDEQPGRRPYLFIAALAYNNHQYIDIWKEIDAYLPSNEARRNMPIKNPILWIYHQNIN